MQVSKFQCPHCSAHLRIRDRTFVGQMVNCPDCTGEFVVAADGSRGFKAETPAPGAPPKKKTVSRKQSRKKEQPNRSNAAKDEKKKEPKKRSPQGIAQPDTATKLSRLTDVLKSPLGIAWTSAIVFAVVLFALAFKGSDKLKRTPVAKKTDISKTNSVADPKTKSVNPPVVIAKKSSSGEIVSKKTEPSHPTKFPNVDSLAPEIIGTPIAAVKPKPPPFGVKPKRVDVAAALKQPILRFQQSKQVPFRILLDEVAELSGVPIRFDSKFRFIAERLDRPVQLNLEKVTVADILQSLVEKVGLAYKIDLDGIRIVQPSSK